jgi:hypothetical protein
VNEGWRDWILDSEGAVRVGRGVRVVAAVGVAIATAILLANLIRGQKVAGLVELLFPAIPALIAGQLWGIALLVARWDRAPASDRPRSRWPFNTGDPRRMLFGGLQIWQANALLAVFFLSWIAGATAFRHLWLGGPTSPAPGCRYRLVNHGEYSCVSRSTYLAAAAAEQRLAAGVLLGFFVLHFGIAAGELRRRRAVSAMTRTGSLQT